MKKFTKNFWTAITFEFFERGSYYAVMSIMSVYFVMSKSEGGLGFSKESVGVIKSSIVPLLYLLPILAGAIADRYGYRRTLFFAFSMMSIGYLLTGLYTSYTAVFASLMIMAVGAGFFKPIITGAIARETNSGNAGLGFGIFYWSINFGSFLFPLFLVPFLKQMSYSYIFYAAAMFTAMLLIINLFVFKEPPRPQTSKSFGVVMKEIILVLKDWRFMLMIVIYSCFWIMYFQLFDAVLWYLKDFVDMTPVNRAVNAFLSLFTNTPTWKFDAEHVTVVGAGTIILLQLIISALVNKTKALPTMVTGILIGVVGMCLLGFGSSAWMFIVGLVIFAIGEMTTHPKFIAYIGEIAPEDKKALYQGYSFLFGVIGSGVGGILGATLYVSLIEQRGEKDLFWAIFAGIGIATALGLLLYNKFIVAPKKKM
jgi:dipeptide/tripeptide permease